MTPEREQPLRVAIVGAGPAGAYAAQHLIDQPFPVEVEMIDRLPTPWGLVRAGVAPDHPQTKRVINSFEWTAARPEFRFHLGVEVGRDISHQELLDHHHAVLYTVGASAGRDLGIPGEVMTGSHSATDFVGWYNGHPDRRELKFDLSGPRAVIIGNGNVALDVARVLVLSHEELARTDISGEVLEALRESAIREVVVLGRRGAAQAAFTTPELIALTQLDDVDLIVEPELEPEEEPGSAGSDGKCSQDFAVGEKLRVLRAAQQAGSSGASRRIVLKFLASPSAISGSDGSAEKLEITINEVDHREDGTIGVRPSGETEEIETGLILRSVGYRGKPVPAVPFDDRSGTIPNRGGRVVDPGTNAHVPGTYVSGWIKRGPRGVIGTNKRCAQETVDALVEDFTDGALSATCGSRSELDELIRKRRPERVDLQGWRAIDAREQRDGAKRGSDRVKLTEIDTMLETARRAA